MAVGADQSDEVQEKADRRNISAVGADPREIKESSEEKADRQNIKNKSPQAHLQDKPTALFCIPVGLSVSKALKGQG
eukprot:20574-Amphidinium_carterae.2